MNFKEYFYWNIFIGRRILKKKLLNRLFLLLVFFFLGCLLKRIDYVSCVF